MGAGTSAHRHWWWLAVLGIVAAGAVLPATVPPRPWVEAYPSLVKLGPGPRPPGTGEISLSAARGECEAAQLAAPAPVHGLLVDAAPLTGPGEPISPSLYRQAFVEVVEPSNAEGRPGRWPDPLVPVRDAYAGQERTAFPAGSLGPEPLAVYYEVCVPATAAGGLYRGVLSVRAQGRDPLHFPVSLKVRTFALPMTSTLPTSFGFSALTAAQVHGFEPGGVEARRLTRLYATAALRHRISLHGLSMDPPPFSRKGARLELDFRAFDEEVGPLLDGEVASGAKFTSIDVRMHPAARSDEEKLLYWRAFAAHLHARGWLDRSFVYAQDEPRPEDLPQVRRFAQLVHRADPRLRVLVTAPLHPLLEGAADLFTPNLNCLFPRPGDDYCPGGAPVSAYDQQRRAGRSLWWYQSCASHGCAPVGPRDSVGRAYFAGWPSYMVDHDGALNRAMGVLAFRHGVEGELYYDTVEAWRPDARAGLPGDPWKGVLRFHGNGDGTLFYPGTPARIGGEEPVPIESLRLKHLRDGLEDYEYLELGRRVGVGAEADRAAATLAPGPNRIVRDPEAWRRARDRLAERIEAALPGGEYREPPPVRAGGRR